MADNKHLTPVAIMYVDGQRLDVEHEGCLREIVIKDMLNGISSFHLVFDTAYTKLADKDLISLESEISIHLGYKDDVEEVFVGDVLRKQALCSEYGTEQYEVSGCNVLHRLKHGEHSVHYEKMTPSAIIKKMIENFSLKAEVDDFGVEAEFSSNDGRSAYDYLLYAANRYGKEFFADKDTIYVANEISIRNDEIILEWGKSLVAFESLLSLKRLLSRYDYVGWDVLKGESFTGGAALEDLPLKVGGDKNWTQVSKGGSGKFTGLVSDMSIADTADAKERAKGILQKNSFWFSQARAKTEGNYKIRPGMRVTLKMIGSKFDGEYIAEEVLHKFNYSDGYTTTVGLKRNMISGVASSGPSPMQQRQMSEPIPQAGGNTNRFYRVTVPSRPTSDSATTPPVETVQETPPPIMENEPSEANIADRTLMGTNGISDNGPCLAMAYMGIAQTYAGQNLTPDQVTGLLNDSSVWDGNLAGSASAVIGAALDELGVDSSALNIVRQDSNVADSDAFGTIRQVGTNDPNIPNHYQEGTNTGGFRWDPLDGAEDTGRNVGAIRNIYITPRTEE
jgi:phage protein D